MARTRQTKRKTTSTSSRTKKSKSMDTSDDVLDSSTLSDSLIDPTTTPPPPKRELQRGKREVELSNFGVGVGDTSEFPSGRGTKKSKLVKSFEGKKDTSSISSLEHVPPTSLIAKVDPSIAGDHSPSISSVNRVKDKSVGIGGRKSDKGTYERKIDESDVPTLQFNTDDYSDQGTRNGGKGSAAHTFYTSLREMRGVGEKDTHEELDDLLEGTAQAYSPYGETGEVVPSKVTPPRVNVHAERKGGPKLHKSNKGVEPLVAQRMINLWYRNPAMFPGSK